jgi:hypothetical protein
MKRFKLKLTMTQDCATTFMSQNCLLPGELQMIDPVAPAVTPLQAAKQLLVTIETPHDSIDRLKNLSRAIDAYLYAVGFLDSESITAIEDKEVEIEQQDDLSVRAAISRNYPELGFYWQAVESKMSDANSGELAVGDAIDDLLDISNELREVFWLLISYGDAQALAALGFRHKSHIQMHIFQLRLHLEELIRFG